ncbi:MAG: CHASE2 domain-containing protein [Acidobacteria bacterium]|nr:CHASE2 domain-containing protein [Acidobacteriota bacterium]
MRSWAQKRVPPERLAYGLLAIFSLLVSLLVGWTGYAARINQNFYDLFFRQRGLRPPTDRIVILAIDDATLAEYGSLPLRRSVLARGIQLIRQGEPRLVAVDLLFAEASTPEEDRELERALAGEPEATEPSESGPNFRFQNFRSMTKAAPMVLATALTADSTRRWLDPLPQLAQRAVAVGHVHADPDSDGVSRQVLLAKQAHQQRYWAFALECFRVARGHPSQPLTETETELEVPLDRNPEGTASVPATRAGQRALLIHYAGPEGTFPRIGLAELLQNPSRSRELEGKIVLIGVTAQAAGDRLFTPFSSGVGMPGVEIHANILHTLLSENYLLPADDLDLVLAAVGVVILTAWMLAGLRGVSQAVLLAGIGLVLLGIPYGLFRLGRVWPAFSLLLPYGTTLLLCGSYQLLRVRRKLTDAEGQQQRARQQFQMVAHEIRTPLTAIQGSSELLARYALDGSKREQMLQVIREESQRLGKMVERFLDVEKLAAGQLELRRAPVELSSLLSRTAERLQPTAERKRIRLLQEGPGPKIEVEADADLLEFAISNLLSNAIKYSPAGNVVRWGLEAARGQVQIHVADSGAGLSEEQKRRIFDRFYRTEGARQSDEPGFGLGLAIAREIALHHGGDLSVENEVGSGTRFTLTIPVPNSVSVGNEDVS